MWIDVKWKFAKESISSFPHFLDPACTHCAFLVICFCMLVYLELYCIHLLETGHFSLNEIKFTLKDTAVTHLFHWQFLENDRCQRSLNHAFKHLINNGKNVSNCDSTLNRELIYSTRSLWQLFSIKFCLLINLLLLWTYDAILVFSF